jgi:predicted Zn-dependent protease
VELPCATNPTTLTACDPTLASAPFPQATLQQVVRSVVTHELGHATGVNTHTSDADDIMYIYTTDWIRDGRFGTEAAALIQIHNKGVQ